MYPRIIRIGGVLCLGAVLSVSALAQNLLPTSTAQIQNLQHTAMKVGIISAAVGVGVTVIGLALRHRHHSGRAGKQNEYQAFAAQYARSRQSAQQSSSGASAQQVTPSQADTSVLTPAPNPR